MDTFHAALVYVGYGTALVIFVIALFSAASGLTSKMARVRAIGLALLFALGASILDRLL